MSEAIDQMMHYPGKPVPGQKEKHSWSRNTDKTEFLDFDYASVENSWQ